MRFLYSCVSDGTVQKIRYTGLYSLQHTNTVIQWTNQKRKRSQITPSNQKASSSLLIVEAPDQADCSLVRKVDGEGPVAVTDQTKPALKLYFWEIVKISFTGSWAVQVLQRKYYNWTLTWSWGNMFTNSGFRMVTQGSKADTLQCHQQYNKWVTFLAKMFTVLRKRWEKKHVYMALTTHSKWIYWYEKPKNILIPNTVVLYCNRITNYENVVFVTKIF